MIKHLLASIILLNCLAVAARAADPGNGFVDYTSALTSGRTGIPIKLKKGDTATTKATFKPPVEIVIEAKTDSTNLRLGYAADQVIFNWEVNRGELRVDGGPAGGKHKAGAGSIPVNKYVTIRWVVKPKRQTIYVDGDLRYEHSGDYSKIANPVSVFAAKNSEVTVKSIKVKQLSADPE